jgi:poly-gamma-glutamate capsule biosynthesis protein CapA/YwtB (metallophosphatase superfamily)
MTRTRPTVDEGFSLTAVGDCIVGRALASILEREPDVAAAMDVVRGADVGVGNLEMGIFDIRGFTGWLAQMRDWALVAPPAVAHDLRSCGFSLVSRANNHAVDWSPEGMRQTGAWLDDAGIVHAGAGASLAEARAPRYVETGRGRVGLVSFHTTAPSDVSQAMDQFGEIPARPGFSSLRLRLSVGLPDVPFDGLRRVENLLDPLGMNAVSVPGSEGFSLFDTRFERADTTAVGYEPFDEDVAQIRHVVRSAREFCDVLIVSAHVHEEGPDGDTQPAFLSEIVRGLLDAGADVFLGHGVHRLWPVEVYDGKPILYGLGNFIVDDTMVPLPPSLFDDARHQVDPSTATEAEVVEALNRECFHDERYFESVIAGLEWTRGRWNVTLRPIDLGFGLGATRRGLPRLARGARADVILRKVAERSRSASTDIVVQGDVAVVGARDAELTPSP